MIKVENSKPKVIIDIERIKNQNTGLYTFCLALYNGLKNRNDLEIYFYKPKNTLVSELNVINYKWYHKIFFRNKKNMIWHSTHQLSKIIPNKKSKFIYTIHDLNFLYTSKSNWKKKMLLSKIQSRIDRADYVTFISEFTKKDVYKYLNLDSKKTKVIYNGVSLKKFEFMERPIKAPDGKFIFSLGVITPKKNFHVLLPLVKKLDLTLVISGQINDKKYAELIKKEAQNLNISERIIITNSISEEEKFWFMSNCDSFMFTSLSEGFGIPPIEAMLLGKPVFLSTKTSLPEIGGKVAYYFEDFNPENMYLVWKNGMEDYEINNKKQDIINWASKFEWEKSCDEYAKIYKSIF